MTDQKTSSLPHVLQEYNPDYEPGTTPKSKIHPHNFDRESSFGSFPKGASNRTTSSHVPISSVRSRSGAASGRTTAASGRSSPSRKSRKSDNKRYEELSDKWDQAKEEVRLEDHEILREKVSLQQELIRKQDEYAEQRRQQIAQAEAEKRETDRAKKQAKHEELQQICKQSLEEDKNLKREEKKAVKSKSKDALSISSTPPSSIPPSPTKSPTTPGGRRSNPFKMTLPAVAPTPDILDSDSEDEEKEQRESTPLQALPWHEQQLYKLYGKKADYFLHPKIENRVQEKRTNPKLVRQGVDQLFNSFQQDEDGRAGAEALWQTLRYDSNQRLLKEDDIIPEDLKDAYSAFARQSLKKNRIPVRRMFCTQDDLPEMPRLLDNRRVQSVRKMRHKSDLMYRASVSNQDRTEVLTFNNPLPEFHERCEGIEQYLPSWQDDQTSESTQPEYAKWLQLRGHFGNENTITEEDGEEGEVTKRPQVTQSLDDDMILVLSRRQKPQTKQKYLFLSEKDTTVKGTFSEKFKGERENKDIPRPYMGDVPKSYSALGGMISATPDATKSRDSSLRYSAPLPTQNMHQKTYMSTWQPLSMHALVEYKKQMSTVGEGDFSLGRTKMWSHIPVV